jgi:membrane-bound metal-dependent hydrolase YbcI (DUF457 family)
MSGIGHLAAGFAAKPITPKVPLWVLLAASETNDILYFLTSSTGIESRAIFTMDFEHGVRYVAPVISPWSHGLFMSIVWSLLAAAIAFLVSRNRRVAGVLGAAVFSHWILDFLMHSNLPVFFDGSHLVGLGLENSGPGFIFITLLDLVLLAGGIAFYWIKRKQAHVRI